jgi:Ca2+-dependent lipid-binding protein
LNKNKKKKYSTRNRISSRKKETKEDKNENDKFLQAIADVEQNLKNIETQNPNTHKSSAQKKKSESLYKSRAKKKRFNTIGNARMGLAKKNKEQSKVAPKTDSRRTQGYNFYKRRTFYFLIFFYFMG